MLSSENVFRPHPLLLAGPPGVGKTAFVQALAGIVGVGFTAIDMSTMTSSFVISGNSYKWEEGTNGVVLGQLRDGKYANPFLLLDELDKVGGDNRYDPYGPLHSLLERESSQQFKDESIDIPIDASHITWVATANDLSKIPEPILSRFTVVDVQKATGADAHKVIRSVWASMRSGEVWGEAFSPCLNEQVIRFLESESPREVKRLLLEACGRIALSRGELGEGKLEITIFDLPYPNPNASENVGMKLN
jgi:energy-coupling factor transporter ATP-binding protein EcfA2